MKIMVDEIAYAEAVIDVLTEISIAAAENGEPDEIKHAMITTALEYYDILQLALFEPTRVEGYDE